MRIALIHAWNANGDLGDRIWNALGRVFPDAERFTTDLFSQLDAIAHLSPRHVKLQSESRERRDSLLSRQSRNNDGQVNLFQYDLVISTSLTAAQQIAVPEGTMHLTFLGVDPEKETHQTPGLQVGLARHDFPASLSFGYHLGFKPRLLGRSERSQQIGTCKATHFLLPTHALAAQLHFDLAKRPHAVLYPSVDTTYFRPGPASHDNFYLHVCHPGVTSDVSIVIDSCQAAHRELVILGGEQARSEIGPLPSLVRWESLPDDADLRSYYRRCRALISTAGTGFDPSLVEAQACGTPVIAYHRAAAEEMILDAETSGQGSGLFYHALTAKSLTSAILELERRPQNISAVLSLAQSTKFSPAHFEHTLTETLSRWIADQALATAKSSSVPMPVKFEEPQRRRVAA